MVFYFFVLCAFQLTGEALVYLADLPIPGPVVGMALLLLFLIVKKGLPEGLDQTASGLLKYLSFLFVPAGTGVILHFNLITNEWFPIAGALIFGTLFTIIFSGLVMKLLDRSA
ncbi:CidA/LrgA family protein [Terasakiella sp. A23]|uniref:CidA/LrgA family protein n=1 Tax=Terasakiella sp. FCG-A23 TaxID=3080561 RepID=UPI002952B0DE|nr:CidA/LrgA family protein [Terasakiella sp. A23]MDV7338986.1 CidA/LrgA family protein [Terasakiella sp. A23]